MLRRLVWFGFAAALLVACGALPVTQEPPVPGPTPGGTLGDRLIAAADAGDVELIRRLLADGADPDARGEGGTTPLMAATKARRTEAVRVLLDQGADVDLQDGDLDNPFLYAGAEGLLDILILANEAGADPAITNRYGGVALIPASERGHVEVIRYLLDETAVNVDHINRLGWTALLEAIILGDGGFRHQQTVGLLIQAGADVDLADGNGVRPLAHARQRGQDEIATMLAAAGASE